MHRQLCSRGYQYAEDYKVKTKTSLGIGNGRRPKKCPHQAYEDTQAVLRQTNPDSTSASTKYLLKLKQLASRQQSSRPHNDRLAGRACDAQCSKAARRSNATPHRWHCSQRACRCAWPPTAHPRTCRRQRLPIYVRLAKVSDERQRRCRLSIGPAPMEERTRKGETTKRKGTNAPPHWPHAANAWPQRCRRGDHG